MSELTQARIDAAREKGRARVWYAAIMPDGGGVEGRSTALNRLIALERAEAADIWTEHLEDHDSGMCGKCWSEAELLAAIEDIEGAG